MTATTQTQQAIITFCERFGIGPAIAWTLPAVFERMAASVDLAELDFISRATSNRELADYVLQVAQTAAAALADADSQELQELAGPACQQIGGECEYQNLSGDYQCRHCGDMDYLH